MILYLDTSDLVKLYVEEEKSTKIRDSVSTCGVVATSIISYAEVRAAFARKFREGGLKEKFYRQFINDLDKDWENYFVLNLTENIVKSAGSLCEKYGLRGFDALHLASALFLKRNSSLSILFSCSDIKLNDVAKSEGFDVIES